MKPKKDIGIDFIEKINKEWYDDAAELHIDCWKERYSKLSSKKYVELDLNVNHDPSLEIESAEEILGRELTIIENDILVKNFNKAVVKNINLKKLKNLF
jgi:hypothetical protein